MIKTIKQMYSMKATLWANSFIFYLRRLILVGKYVPEGLYGNYKVKKVLAVLAFIFKQITEIFGKFVYLLILIMFPCIMIIKSNSHMAGQEILVVTYILFFLNCILGPWQDSEFFSVTREKITLVFGMQMPLKQYVQSSFFVKYISFFLSYIPSLLIVLAMLNCNLWATISIWVLLVGFRIFTEALHLLIFDKTKKIIPREMKIVWPIIIGCLAAGYAPLFFGYGLSFARFLLHPAVTAVVFVMGGIGLWYILKYNNYGHDFRATIQTKLLTDEMVKAAQANQFSDVEVKEKDLLSTKTNPLINSLKGYNYFNAIFFARHRRQLVRPIYIRLAVVLLCFVILFVVNIFKPDTLAGFAVNLRGILPIMVFAMYLLNSGEKACRAMFYNCDISMLRFSFYRKQSTILKTFQIRLLKIIGYNLLPALAVCAGAVLVLLVTGTAVFTLDFFMFSIAVVLLSVFFTVHHLCMYYVFQPYSSELQIKNPFFNFINSAMYFVCFISLQISTAGAVFTTIVCIATVIYIAAALVLVYMLAPKNFKVK